MRKSNGRLAALLLSLSISLPMSFSSTQSCFAAQGATDPVVEHSSDPWWKHAVFYEIYPRSFADSNGDGIGDLNGITAHLDYLQNLGVDAVWLTPCYPSPQVDFGYDISDYCNIDPVYGTLADFDKLVAEAKKRNIRIVMDFVINHTSDKHPWFIASRSSKTDSKRDWYIWRDGKAPSKPPNNWQSIFGHSAWDLDPRTGQYYYHFFYPQQPDLNGRNPDVRKAMYDVTRFWMDRGVAGFRLDAVGCLFEDPNLHDNPIQPGTNAFGDANMESKYNDRLEEVHDVMRELRHVIDSYPGDRVLIGETSGNDVKQVSRMFGGKLDEIQLPMNFFFAYLNKLSVPDFRRIIDEWDKNPAQGWPLYFFSNHDQVRHYVRYGDKVNNDAIAKLTATLLMTLRGTPLLYYGEEIGMENNDPKRVEDVYDPIGKIGWPKEKGRDGERTPMQWDGNQYAGFSHVKPWLMPADSFASHNAATEEGQPDSVLNFYKKLIQLRRTEPLRGGEYVPINASDLNVLAYLRKGAAGTVMVAINMSNQEQAFKPELPGAKYSAGASHVLLRSGEAAKANEKDDVIRLSPYAVQICALP
ncbi:MAG TPA: alpha-glucosidase [Trichormus sp.]